MMTKIQCKMTDNEISDIMTMMLNMMTKYDDKILNMMTGYDEHDIYYEIALPGSMVMKTKVGTVTTRASARLMTHPRDIAKGPKNKLKKITKKYKNKYKKNTISLTKYLKDYPISKTRAHPAA